ncbi:helix-turn-helix domain-containing protein [Pseudarthrobacter humi]|uniref:helix-turn-helix domain-containing protein n=1 Tax=Pseudarthrobacter humi TaxID=2952523 RepID=UPI003558344B
MKAGLVQRARTILMAADGAPNSRIAEAVGVSVPTVLAWRGRYQERGMVGLEDEGRSGGPREIDRMKIIAATLTPPPASLALTLAKSQAKDNFKHAALRPSLSRPRIPRSRWCSNPTLPTWRA